MYVCISVCVELVFFTIVLNPVNVDGAENTSFVIDVGAQEDRMRYNVCVRAH